MNKISKAAERSLNRIAEQAVPDNLDLWPRIRSGIEAARVARPSSMIGKRNRRRLVIGIAAAVLLALVIGATAPLWNAPEAVSAQTILDRAQSSADSAVAVVHTYHLKMTRQVPGKGNTTISTEIWFGARDRQRSDEQVRDASGATVSTSEVVFNGAQVWMARTEGGQTWVVHTVGTTWSEPAEDPSRQQNLTDVLKQYSSPKACMNAQLEGEAQVAGQTTFVIVVTQKPDACAAALANPTAEAKARAAKSVGQATVGIQSERMRAWVEMRVWVDKLTYLPLKTEVRSPSGAVLDQSVVTSVEYNVAIPDTVFSYTAPSGARVFNFTGGDGVDVKAALCSDLSKGNCPQSHPPSQKP